MTVRGQLARFAVVGVVNTGTYYACYLSLLYRLPYVVSHVVAFALSMTGSFFLNSRFTYRTRPTWRKFLLFPLTNAANFVVSTTGVYLLVHVARYDSRYAPLLATAAAVPITFLVSRAILLRPDRRGAGTTGGRDGTARGTGPREGQGRERERAGPPIPW